MSHKQFIYVLACLNVFMGSLLIFSNFTMCDYSSTRCPGSTLSAVFIDISPAHAAWESEPEYYLLPLDQVYLPRQIQGFAIANQLGCYSDGEHDMLASTMRNVTLSELYRSSALLSGAEGGNLSVVKYLLNAGMNPNQMDCYGNTPLSLALDNHHAEVVNLLLRSGADESFAVWSW